MSDLNTGMKCLLCGNLLVGRASFRIFKNVYTCSTCYDSHSSYKDFHRINRFKIISIVLVTDLESCNQYRILGSSSNLVYESKFLGLPAILRSGDYKDDCIYTIKFIYNIDTNSIVGVARSGIIKQDWLSISAAISDLDKSSLSLDDSEIKFLESNQE